ncbi:MAG TPA: TOMM precursor leader peptide-binding protein [Burkholderiaceae bacterium]|nr:TOMM precursor leader peptide-binding protein [Burkholderiaceae bacterium]
MNGPYYRLAAGVDVVPLSGPAILFRSSTLAVKIEGEIAPILAKRVVPLLESPRALQEIQNSLADLPGNILQERLDELVKARVLEISLTREERIASSPFDLFFENIGTDSAQVAKQLSSSCVAIFGLEGPGAWLALHLARLGVELVLADPFPTDEADTLLMPPTGNSRLATRQEDVAQLVAVAAPFCKVTTGGTLSKEEVAKIAEKSTLLVSCFDRGFETTHHWVNRAAVGSGVPALFCSISTHISVLGPGVIPGQTACYMCYRMRRVACEENYDEAMAYERFLNERRKPSLSRRPMAPFLASQVGSVLASEVVKMLGLGMPMSVSGRIVEYDSLTLQSEFHAVSQQPDCPICGSKKKSLVRNNLGLEALTLAEGTSTSGDLRTLASELVSRRCGVVRLLESFAKDSAEPPVPYIARADIANHRFISKREDDADICSGKGITLDEARISALGEAVERYSGAVYRPDEVVYARRSELDGRSLDPVDLVLYHPSQYPALPYAPYEDNRLGWVSARSLASNENVLTPAMAVFMNYRAHDAPEFLFPITSNGLAAGRTLLQAVLSAAGEVLERDAFTIAWLNRLPARRFAATLHPDTDIANIALSYQRRGVDIRLYLLPTDHEMSVFAAVAVEQGPDGPALVFGLGAGWDPVEASRKAVLEVGQVRPALRRRMRRPDAQKRLQVLLSDPREVATIDDHDLLYASPKAMEKAAFWLDVAEEPFTFRRRSTLPASTLLGHLVDWLRSHGSDLLYVNLTPPDMERLGLYTARAILPKFQPIDFGWKERRLGGDRLYQLPATLGFRSRPVRWEELNHDPHPLA